ncbi:DUF3082 domain-containing protein [Oculatella sp. LEGE 06141]|uniref:DUF3082 domain-containing protein n=1 Tax=Oculatella sp. LEGE 06141 TaxID=1828648 RepID=UPI0018823727|nr:DUF3082 domain-containing protein [Oculatella sp. LEGE 06141]MBE9182174.1 DUF3082 domain-containing protein [Oculatella sp. LEGE 06141]
MANSTPPDSSSASANSQNANQQVPPTRLRCFTGALISGVIAFVLYLLTQSIVHTFADKPLPTSNITAINIAVAVRTLVMGMSTLATAIFGIAALGLTALGIRGPNN